MQSTIQAFCFCFAASAGIAAAGELPSGRISKPALDKSLCAAYGPGFVPIAGTDTCVRISGHVRMEYIFGRAGPSPSRGSESGASAYVSKEVAPAAPDSGLVFGRLKPGSLKPRGLSTAFPHAAP